MPPFEVETVRYADHLAESCGVFGIFGRDDAARHAYLGLYALQHRGQESAGIVACDGSLLHLHKDIESSTKLRASTEWSTTSAPNPRAQSSGSSVSHQACRSRLWRSTLS